MTEEWKDIIGYEGSYQISNLGRVKSIARIIYRSNGVLLQIQERILSLAINCKKRSDGRELMYYSITLNHQFKGKKNFEVHKLVAVAFINHKTNGKTDFVIDHIDDDSLNNRFDNLRIITNRENISKGFLNKDNKTSKYTGVSFAKNRNKYRSSIRINNIQIVLFEHIDEDYIGKSYALALQNSNLFDGDKDKFRKLIKQLLQ